MSTIMPPGFLSKSKDRIIDLGEIKKYEQPDYSIEYLGEPGRDTLETIEEKLRKNPLYEYSKITIKKTESKKKRKRCL